MNYQEMIDDLNIFFKKNLLAVEASMEKVVKDGGSEINFVLTNTLGKEIVKKSNWNTFLKEVSISFLWRGSALKLDKWFIPDV